MPWAGHFDTTNTAFAGNRVGRSHVSSSHAVCPPLDSDPEGPHAAIYRDIASKVWAEIERNREGGQRAAPRIVIES